MLLILAWKSEDVDGSANPMMTAKSFFDLFRPTNG